MRRLVVVAILACISWPAAAQAGRSRYGWLYDTETLPERGVELETWILEENGKGTSTIPAEDETLIWWSPVIGLTDQLELALPIEIVYKERGMISGTELERFGAELRWRLTDPDPVQGGPFSALVRLGAKRPITSRSAVRLEADVVLALELGRVHMATDLGGVLKADDSGVTEFQARPSAGVSVRVAGELRFGAELYAELKYADDDKGVDWASLGPNLAWTHGRFWLSGSFPIGLHNLSTAPRLNFAVAF